MILSSSFWIHKITTTTTTLAALRMEEEKERKERERERKKVYFLLFDIEQPKIEMSSFSTSGNEKFHLFEPAMNR